MASAGIRVSVIFDSLAYQAEALKEARKVMDNIQGQADKKPIKLNVTLLDKKNEKMLVSVQNLLDNTTTSSKTLKLALEQLAGQWRDLADRQAELESKGNWLTKKGGLSKSAKEVASSMEEVNAAMAAVSERISGVSSAEGELSLAIAKRKKAQMTETMERIAKEAEYNAFLKQEMTTLEELDSKRKILNHKLTITPVGSPESAAYIQELVYTEAEIRRVQAEISKMKSEAVIAAMEMAQKMGDPRMVINELQQQVSALTNAMREVDVNSEEFDEYGRALMDASRDLDTANAAMQKYTYTTKQSAVAAEQFRIRYKEAMADTTQSTAALQARVSVLREKLSRMDVTDTNYNAVTQELVQNEIALKKVQAAQEALISTQVMAVEKELALRKQELAAIAAVDMTMVGLNAKMAYYQQLMNSNDVGSTQFQTAAQQVMILSEKMAELQAQIMRTTTADGSINRLSGELAEINRQWAAMGSSEKFVDAEMTQLSPKASALKEEYIRITAELQQQGKSLEQLTAAEREALKIAEKRKEAEKREAEILSNTAKTIADAQEKVSILTKKLNTTEVGTEGFAKTAKDLNAAKKELAGLQEKAIQYGTDGEGAVRKVNKGLATQHGYIGRLLLRMGLYSSIFTAVRWVKNIREVTAEFELQRVALGSIIQDAEMADKMFNRIKGAAVESPFEIKDLVSYTKQLSAFRVETDKLFDTMMQLADVSAGLGVDMSRLILAYGQVRAASVLRGQELRQFTESGIPLVELLADKFSELRGEMVSTGDVFGLISDRAVPFSMIAEIFDDMTSAGGLFYQMQEKQAKTLKGEWNNLKDAISIMYDEIGRTEEAQDAMRSIISLSKFLATHWRACSVALEGLLAGFVVYKIALKQTAVESAKLSVKEALAAVAKDKHTLSTSKLITALFGEKAALALNNKLLHLYHLATVKAATASTVLSKAIWKMVAALAANPYTAAAVAITVLVVGLIKLTTITKTTEQRIEELEQATQKFNDAAKKTTSISEMIDSYEELSKKQNKTEQESKKLADITKTLAALFPSAVSGIDSETNSVKLLAETMRDLNKATKEVMATSLQKQIYDDEKALKKLQDKVAKYSEDLANNGATLMIESRGNWFKDFMFGSKFITDPAEQGEYITELIEQIGRLKSSIQEAKDALEGLGGAKPETKVFDGWKAKLQTFKKDVVSANGKDKTTLTLFTDDEIENFGHLDSALDDVAKKYKGYHQQVITLKNALKGKEGVEKRQIQNQIERASAYEKMSYGVLLYYNALKLLDKKTSPSDPRLQNLQEEVSLVEKIYSKYKDYLNYMSREEAKSKIQSQFGATIKTLRFGAAFDDTSMRDILLKYQSAAKKLPKSSKAVMEIGFKADDVSWNGFKDKVKERLSIFKEEISKTQTAKSFYDDVLDITGDKEVSQRLSLSVFGQDGKMLKAEITEQLREAFADVKVEGMDASIIDKAIVERDFVFLNTLIEKVPEEYRSAAKEIINDGQKTNAEWLKNLIKTYQKAKSYEEQITDIRAKAAQKRSEIAKDSSLNAADKKQYTKAVGRQETKDVAKVQMNALKESEEWIKVFENIDRIGNGSIENLINQLSRFIKVNKADLSPTDLRTLVQELEKLEKASAVQNPWKAITSGLKEYIVGIREFNAAKKEQKDITKEERAEAVAYENTEDELTREQAKLSMMQATDKGYKEQAAKVAALTARLAKLKGSYDKVTAVTKKSNAAWDKMKKGLNKVEDGVNGVSSALSAVKNAYDSITDLFDVDQTTEFGAALGAVSESLGLVVAALIAVNAVLAVTEALGDTLLANPIFLAIAAAVMAVITAFKIFNAVKTAKANKEIEAQNEVVDRLKYSYDKLKEAMEDAFGSDYIKNLDDQKAALDAEIIAYEKMIEAERSKGKKADKKQIKEWETTIRDLRDEKAEMEGQLAEHFTGTDVTSAARDFATAWIEAYKTFSSTTGAISEKFHEMIQNMIIESLAAKVIQSILQPLFDEIDAMASDGDLTAEEIAKISGETDAYIKTIDVAMTSLMNELNAAGYNIRKETSGLSGISKDIASASEESILGLAAGINTQNFYISHIYNSVDQILAVLLGGSQVASGVKSASAAAASEQDYFSYLPTIAQNTADAVSRCERAAVACEEIANNLSKVVKPKGTAASYAIQVQGV